MDLSTLAARAADYLDGLPAGSRVGSPVPRLSVFRSTAPTALTPDLYEPVVCLILQGHDVGYASPNQFSREYARRFGVPPREHLPSTATG